MKKLKKVIEQYGRWSVYSMYVDRIEAHVDSDFSICVENSKSLIEGISKQICKEKGIAIASDEPFNRLVKTAFSAIGYLPGEHLNVISGSLSAIAQQLGNLRTALGSTSHGKPIEELTSRNETLDSLTKEFLIDTVEILTCFLIRNFENENPRTKAEPIEETLDYWEAEEFNEFWDDSFGEFQMGNYSYAASEIFFNVDKQAYINEYNAFSASETTEE
jgi:hypothetical protein